MFKFNPIILKGFYMSLLKLKGFHDILTGHRKYCSSKPYYGYFCHIESETKWKKSYLFLEIIEQPWF